MINNDRQLDGLNKYPDLKSRAQAELSSAGNGCCVRSNIIRKYQQEFNNREKRHAIETTSTPIGNRRRSSN